MTEPTATLCAIVKDEGPYLLEWIAYQRVIGFDQLLIYDNGSADVGGPVLRELAAAGVLQVRPWPTIRPRSPQLTAYADGLRRVETDFISFLDVDEFLVLHQDETVGRWLSRFPTDTGAIAINWRIFGTAGAARFEARPVMKRFTRCAAPGVGNNYHLKYFARPGLVERAHIHYCVLTAGQYLNADGAPLQMSRLSFSDTVTFATAQVNHYALKSREEYEWKRARGNANRPFDPPTPPSPEYWASLDRNEEEDTSILGRLDATLDEMERLSRLLTAGTWAGLAKYGPRPRLTAMTRRIGRLGRRRA